jgi:hypothetical protein
VSSTRVVSNVSNLALPKEERARKKETTRLQGEQGRRGRFGRCYKAK